MWSWRKLWTRAVTGAVLRVHDYGSQENWGTSFSYVLTMVLNIWIFLKNQIITFLTVGSFMTNRAVLWFWFNIFIKKKLVIFQF
jgi:hypothetical protein